MGLLIEKLSVRYQNFIAVNQIDLDIDSGQVIVIVGPNGCGKSTLLRSIARLHRPESGKIFVDGEEVWKLKPKQAAHRIALLPQSPQAPEGITVSGLVQYGRHPHQGLFQQWSKKDERVVMESLEATGMIDLADRELEQLSGGQRQRCWLAMVLAQETPFILLDEPTSMLDLGHQVEVLNLVKSLSLQGRTIVVVLHDLFSAARYADTLVAMRKGEIVKIGSPKEIVDTDLVRELYDVDADILTAPTDGTPLIVPSVTTGNLGKEGVSREKQHLSFVKSA